MGIFEDQIKYRKENDDKCFEDSLHGIADAVMGTRLSNSEHERESTNSAIEEILKYFHLKNRYTSLPSDIVSVEQRIEYITRPFGIAYRSVTLEKGWYRHAAGPMLAVLKESGASAALIPGKFSGYRIVNPETGMRERLTRTTQTLLEEEAVCFYKPLPMKKLSVRDLLKYIASLLSVSDIALYLLAIAAISLTGLLAPYFTKQLFGSVLESGSRRVLLALAAFMTCYSISRLCFSVFKNLMNDKVVTKQNIAVEAAVMSRMMTLPPAFFKDYASGELAKRASYVKSLCTALFNAIGDTGFTSVFSLVYLGEIFSYAPSLVVPSIIITLLTGGFGLAVTFHKIKCTEEIMNVESKLGGLTYSMINGIEKIKLAGAEKRMFSRWAKEYAKDAELEYNFPPVIKFSSTITLAISLAGTMILYYSAVKNRVSVADYYAFTSAFGMISGMFASIFSVASSSAFIKPVLEMARPILEAVPEPAEEKEIVTSLRGGIELNNVSFRYNDNMPNVIDNLSLKINPGDYIAITGATGCGKSTLLRLLLGFEKPQKGSIYFDRKDISRIDLQSLRRMIGTVMQNGKLFFGSIYSNIVISAPWLTMDDAWEAAETAQIADDIRALPMGMQTIISEGHGGFSGGQKQRLMIAGAIAPKPKILMFDEATSALDNITQKKIAEAIDSLDCTRIIIAHRLSTIKRCDRIIVLDGGKVAEDGTYDELIANKGLFYELVERQRPEV